MSYGRKKRSARYEAPSKKNVLNDGVVVGDPVALEASLRVDSFFGLFGRVSGAIARKSVPVVAGPTRFGTGHTDGVTITIDDAEINRVMKAAVKNRDLGGSKVADELAKMEGLLYHELSHVLYTPRHTHRPTKDILALPEWWATFAYNILEDTRIEAFFLAKHPPATPYFKRLITGFILKNADGKPVESTSWLLLHGRRYLSRNLRDSFRAAFEKENGDIVGIDVDRLADLIDEYRSLIFPKDADRAVELVKELADAIAILKSSSDEDVPGEIDSHDHHRNGKADLDDSKEAKKRLDEESDDEESDDDEASGGGGESDKAEGDDESGEPCDEGEPGDGEGEGSEGGEGEGPGTGEGDDEDGDGTSDEAGGEASADGASGDNGDITGKSLKELVDEERAEADAELERPIREKLKEANKAFNDESDVELGEPSTEFRGAPLAPNLTPGHKIAKADLVRVFEEVRGATEPRWEKKVDKGRLNVAAAMEARGAHTSVFDRWTDEGEDAASIEAVVLVDLSSSMHGMIADTSYGVWILTAAADELGIPMTVLGYNAEAHVLALPGDGPLDAMIKCWGGTTPTNSLAAAERIFTASEARHKLLFSLTDGDWFSADEAHDTVKRINALEGARSVLLYLTSRRYSAEYIHSVYKDLGEVKNHFHDRAFVGSPRDAVKVIGEEMTAAVEEAY